MTVEVPFQKGYAGVDYRTLLGLHRSSTAGGAALQKPGDPAWDIWIGPLPFLLAPSQERPYVRESVPVRRERFDSGRDPGENSLDSGLWIRSWTSWHLGAGQTQVEPLETDQEVARFRYESSAGIDPWTSGEVSLLHSCEPYPGEFRRLTAHPDYGVIASSEDGVRLISDSGDSELSSDDIEQITVGFGYWYGISSAGGVLRGPLTGGAGAAVPGVSNATCIQIAKDRLWVGAGSNLYEVTDPAVGPTTPFHTFRDGKIIDIDTGAGGLYVMVDSGLTTIYVVTANADGVLLPPEEVAVLPRGETGTMLYGYLSRYLVVGTTKGARVADCSTSESLALGPLVVEITGGCLDATADANFVWLTGGDEKIDVEGDGSDMRAGLYRMDLSRQVTTVSAYGDSAAARYPYATDLYTASGTAARAASVTTYESRIYWVDSDGVLWRQADERVTYGYIGSGWVTFATAEGKAWQSIFADVRGEGFVGSLCDTGSGWAPVLQTALATPVIGEAEIDTRVHPAGTSLRIRATLYGNGVTTPVLQAVSLRAMPAAKRTRYVRMPLMVFDLETDRYGQAFGYETFATDRLHDLEALEENGGLIKYYDTRSGEVLSCQVDRVSFESYTPPSAGQPNYGGIATVTLITV